MYGDHPYITEKRKEFYRYIVLEPQSEAGLYESCKKFADIGITAPKQKVDKIGTVQVCFQFKDIEAAEQAFMRYAETHEIKDVEGLLQVVENYTHLQLRMECVHQD